MCSASSHRASSSEFLIVALRARTCAPGLTCRNLARVTSSVGPRSASLMRWTSSATTRFSPSKAGPIASACGGYSSSIPCFSRISTIRGSRPRSATRISHLMRRGPHKGSRGRRERVHIPGDPWRCLGTASTECPVGSVLPGLAHEPELLQEFDLVVVDVALRNLAAFHLVHDAPSKLDPIPGGRDDAVTLRPKQPPVEAMAQRPFVRSLNQEFHADPVALSEAAHPRPREIGQRFAPGPESVLNGLAPFL